MNYIFDQINQNSYEIDQGNVTMSLTNWQNDANTHASTQARKHSRKYEHIHTHSAHFLSVWFDIRVLSLYRFCDQLLLKSVLYCEITLIDRGFS